MPPSAVTITGRPPLARRRWARRLAGESRQQTAHAQEGARQHRQLGQLPPVEEVLQALVGAGIDRQVVAGEPRGEVDGGVLAVVEQRTARVADRCDGRLVNPGANRAGPSKRQSYRATRATGDGESHELSQARAERVAGDQLGMVL